MAPGERLVHERRRWRTGSPQAIGQGRRGPEGEREEGEEDAGTVEQEGSLSLDVDSSQAALRRRAGRQPTAFGRGKQARIRPLLLTNGGSKN